jgi:hypothetical protein
MLITNRCKKMSDKRTTKDLVNDVYDFLEQQGEIYQSKLREVVSSPSDKNILELILLIQDKPYLQLRKEGRYKYIKLSIKPRSEESHQEPIENIIDEYKSRYEELRKSEASSNISKIYQTLEYKTMMEEILGDLSNLLKKEGVKNNRP